MTGDTVQLHVHGTPEARPAEMLLTVKADAFELQLDPGQGQGRFLAWR